MVHPNQGLRPPRIVNLFITYPIRKEYNPHHICCNLFCIFLKSHLHRTIKKETIQTYGKASHFNHGLTNQNNQITQDRICKELIDIT